MKLVSFLKKLNNEIVTVETKDNLTIKGTITKVDKFNNLYLKEIHFGDTKIDKFTIKGTNIRYIVFRKDLSIESLVKKLKK